MASTSAAGCLLGLVGLLSVCLAAPPVQNESVRDGPYRDFKGESNIEPDDVIRHIDSFGGDHLLRSLQRLGAAALLRRAGRSGSLDSLSGVTFGGSKRYDPLSGKGFGSQKRNFDEIDRTGFNSFVKKNFDEIDRSGFDSFVKKNFDEIDRAGFGGFVKRGDSWLPGRYYEEAH